MAFSLRGVPSARATAEVASGCTGGSLKACYATVEKNFDKYVRQLCDTLKDKAGDPFGTASYSCYVGWLSSRLDARKDCRASCPKPKKKPPAAPPGGGGGIHATRRRRPHSDLRQRRLRPGRHLLQERLGADLLRDLLLQERRLRFLQQRLRMNADQTTRERTVETSWIRI